MGNDPLGITRTDRTGKLSLLESTLPLFKNVTTIFTAILINRHCPTPLCIRESLKIPEVDPDKICEHPPCGH
jgi:hypothetical protein